MAPVDARPHPPSCGNRLSRCRACEDLIRLSSDGQRFRVRRNLCGSVDPKPDCTTLERLDRMRRASRTPPTDDVVSKSGPVILRCRQGPGSGGHGRRRWRPRQRAACVSYREARPPLPRLRPARHVSTSWRSTGSAPANGCASVDRARSESRDVERISHRHEHAFASKRSGTRLRFAPGRGTARPPLGPDELPGSRPECRRPGPSGEQVALADKPKDQRPPIPRRGERSVRASRAATA